MTKEDIKKSESLTDFFPKKKSVVSYTLLLENYWMDNRNES